MLGQLKRDHREVDIVGGGASGLFSAYALLKAGYRVTLSEASEHTGGMIRTTQSSYGLVETAANSLVWTPDLQSLCDDADVPLLDLDPKAKGKYILRHGRPSSLPLGPKAILEMLWRASTVRAHTTDPDVESWAKAHLGPAAAQYLIEAMVAGIYASPARDLSLNLALPRLVVRQGHTLFGELWAKRKESKSKRRVVVPKEGMASLFRKLCDYLQKQERFNLQVNKRVVTLPQGENTIIATSALAAADLIETVHPELAQLLKGISYAPLVSVSLFVKQTDLARVPAGLGVLMPPCEKRNVLGILYSSSSFPNRVHASEHALFTVLLGGRARAELLTRSDSEISAIALNELQQIFGFRGSPLEIALHRWPHAIPVYSHQLQETLVQLRQALAKTPGLVLAGSYAGDVSLRGMLSNAMRFSEVQEGQ